MTIITIYKYSYIYPPIFSRVRVAQSVVFCVVLYFVCPSIYGF